MDDAVFVHVTKTKCKCSQIDLSLFAFNLFIIGSVYISFGPSRVIIKEETALPVISKCVMQPHHKRTFHNFSSQKFIFNHSLVSFARVGFQGIIFAILLISGELQRFGSRKQLSIADSGTSNPKSDGRLPTRGFQIPGSMLTRRIWDLESQHRRSPVRSGIQNPRFDGF